MFRYMWRISIVLNLALTSYLIIQAQNVAPFPAGIKTVCFSRGESIYLSNLKTGTTKLILKGHDPNLSPSGIFIAFTAHIKGPNDPDRTIKVLNLETNQIKDFKSLNGHISYGALWSPDETQLALNILVDEKWHVGILNVSSGGLQILTQGLPNNFGANLSSWLLDGKSILCSDLRFIYELGLNGAVMRKIPVEKLVNPSRVTSSTKFSLSKDKRYMLFDTTDGPDSSSIYVYDFAKQALLRVTSEKIGGAEPQWLPSEKEILFTKYRRINKRSFTFDVFKISIDGRNLVQLMRDASSISYSV
jgi:Tol biopolymer transport system component